MKKVLLSAAFALTAIATTTTAANAQEGLSVGIRAIPQATWMLNSDQKDLPGYESKTTFGAAFGVGANYNFTKNMGVGLDVLYSMQGQKSELAGIENTIKTSYLKIPLMFTYNTGIDSNRKVAFIGKLGPQMGVRLTSKDEMSGVEVPGTKDAYRNVNFGAVAGAGARFALAQNITLDAGVRFDYEFTDAKESAYKIGDAATNNMTLGVEVGLNYNIR